MPRRKTARATLTLSHEEVHGHLIAYHFSRLSPELNAAVERHVRSCPICRREGLDHLATEKVVAARRTLRLRGRDQRIRAARVMRLMALVLAVVLLDLLLLVAISRSGGLPWLSTGGSTSAAEPTATIKPTPHAVPTLTAALTFGSLTSGIVATAVSPDGRSVALAGQESGAIVGIWDASTGRQVRLVTYSLNEIPGVLAWSPDGKWLAAATGGHVVVWSVTNGSQAWILPLPQAAAIRVYDALAGSVILRLDPVAAFAHEPFLQWGSGGQLSPVAASASPTGVAIANGPVVGVWQTAGTHLFSGAGAQAVAGISAGDSVAHLALLTWSPDSRYLLWASFAQPVSLSSPATPSASTTDAPDPVAVSPPNSLASALAARVASHSGTDALLWFSPGGQWVAVCDRTQRGAPLEIYRSGRAVPAGQISGGCQSLTTSGLSWRTDATGFVLALPAHQAASYNVPAATHT